MLINRWRRGEFVFYVHTDNALGLSDELGGKTEASLMLAGVSYFLNGEDEELV